MKHQCDKHGCSELLCGCATELLEDDNHWNEMIVAKNKWIKELLEENTELKKGLEFYGDEDNYVWDFCQDTGSHCNTSLDGGKQAREILDKCKRKLNE